jgi:hypothetical protein
VIENLLKLRRCFRDLLQLQINLPAQVLRPEFGGGFVARRCLQLLKRLRRLPALQIKRRADRGQPDGIDEGIFRVAGVRPTLMHSVYSDSVQDAIMQNRASSLSNSFR